MSKLIHIDQDYKQWIQDLKSRYRRSQIKASVKVNYEVLSFYWQLGRDIVNLDVENRWGSGFMRMLSQDLKQELPEATGLTFTNLYDRQGKAITNFSATLPAETSDLARELTKDPYDFAFAEVTGKFNETKLKAALLRNMTQFLVELGTYVTAVNHILRDPEKDNPTIGLLVCKGKDNTLAQYALESSSQPLGISEYELQKLYPTKVEGTIPTIAEIESVAQDTVVKPEENEEKLK